MAGHSAVLFFAENARFLSLLRQSGLKTHTVLRQHSYYASFWQYSWTATQMSVLNRGIPLPKEKMWPVRLHCDISKTVRSKI